MQASTSTFPNIQICICFEGAVFQTPFFTFLEIHDVPIKPRRRCVRQFRSFLLEEPFSIIATQWSPLNTYTSIRPIYWIPSIWRFGYKSFEAFTYKRLVDIEVSVCTTCSIIFTLICLGGRKKLTTLCVIHPYEPLPNPWWVQYIAWENRLICVGIYTDLFLIQQHEFV